MPTTDQPDHTSLNARVTLPAHMLETLNDRIAALDAENTRLRASVKQLIEFRNVKVWEANELAERLKAVRALAEGAHGDGDFGSVPARDLLAALGDPHPAEGRPAVVLPAAEEPQP